MPPTVEAPSRAKGAPSRRRLAALSAVGALVLALPLVQVLRFQAETLSAVNRERTGLDPLAHAVNVQQHLILHRNLSSLVLRGQLSREPQRMQQQGSVDSALVLLQSDFGFGLWPRARDEAAALGSGWALLKEALAASRMAAAQSESAHRLLIEHCLQITDDVTDAMGVQTSLGADPAAVQPRQIRDLSRQIWRTAQATPPTPQLQDKAHAALNLQLQQFRALHTAADKALATRGNVLLRQRAALLAALAALFIAGLAAVVHLLRTRPTRVPPEPPQPGWQPQRAVAEPRDASGAASRATRSAILRMKAADAMQDVGNAPATVPPPR